MDAALMTPDDFERAVDGNFTGVLAAYGFAVTSATDFSMRFERQEGIFVQVDYDVRRSHELSLWLGRTGCEESALALAELLRVTDCPDSVVASVQLIQVESFPALGQELETCSRLLREYGEPFLRGDSHAFADAASERSSRAHRYTSDAVIAPTLHEADAAWRRGDYGRVRELLTPIRSDLGAAHLRRLQFIERRERA